MTTTHSQPDLITLPMPHSWFEAETSLPRYRMNPRNIKAGVAALQIAAQRVHADIAAPDTDADDNTLDGAQRSFDRYFCVDRSMAPPVDVFRLALSRVIPGSAGDIAGGHSLSEAELTTLATGLHRLADWAQFPSALPDGSGAPDNSAPDALFRWKQQHHLFFVLIHGLLYLLHVLEEALDKGHAPVVRYILEDLADLLEASTVAFQIASDFSQDAYEEVIRPDMLAHDPHFSGLFYADHKEFVTRLRVLRRVPDDFEDEMARINDAITNAYEAHALVCLRFVGESASLASKDESRVAAESIRQKYVKRTKTIAGFTTPDRPTS